MTHPTQTAAERFAPVLIRLLEAMVDNPEQVKIASDEIPGGINWGFQCEAGDVRKVIGKQGSRLRALRLVVDLAGREAREEWRIYAPKPSGETRPPVKAQKPATFSPVASILLLCDLLESVGATAAVVSTGSAEAGFSLQIRPLYAESRTALLEMHEALYAPTQQETQPINLIGSLGTIYRGIAGKNGVKFHLDVV